MLANDVLFFNLHRKYLNNKAMFGGFIGIFALAAFLRDNGYAAQSFAGTLTEGLKLIDEACKEQKVSLIGLYCDYENVTENIFLSHYIKEKYGLPVIVGGPQATALGLEFMLESKCDALVQYEGELTVLELAGYFLDEVGELRKIKGIGYLQEGAYKLNPYREEIQNLDALPFITEECYLQGNPEPHRLNIMTGRGCPFHCAFCHEGHHTRSVRFRSVDNVMAEIEAFTQKFTPREYSDLYVLFTDDTFTLVSQRVQELCTRIAHLRERVPFNFFCEAHIHTLYLHPEMIDAIAKAGAHRLQVGIEAGTQKVLDAYEKGSTLDEIREVVGRCRDAGIKQIYSNIILGGAFFSKEVYEQDLLFALELLRLGQGAVEIGVVSYWPLPGTAITKQPEKYGLKITDYDFLTAVGDFPQTETAELSKWEIMCYVKEMQQQILSTMQVMLEHDEIPFATVLEWFPQQHDEKKTGLWWRCLQTMPTVLAWYEMQLYGEGFRREELSKEQWLVSHPLRVIPLVNGATVNSKGEMRIEGEILSTVERDVLILSTGKLAVNTIAEKLRAKARLEEISAALTALEKKHLIVYARY